MIKKNDTLISIISNYANGSLFCPWFFTRVNRRAIDEINHLIKINNYEFIWIEFPSSLGFVNFIAHDDVRYCAHDVVAQRIGRSLFKRPLQILVNRIESSLLKKTKEISTLSEKDVILIHKMGFTGNTHIIDIGQQSVGFVDNAKSINDIVKQFDDKINLVFFGNMKRPENNWSIIWFILFVFLPVQRKHKNLHLWVLGIFPKPLLKILSKIIPNIHVEGAVDNPVPAFEHSDYCIAPLLFGAGVKIKVIQMIDSGAKVIATPVGAEGVTNTKGLTIVETKKFKSYLLQLLT